MELEHFLQNYSESGISRFHMPGHKGNFPPLTRIDNLSAYDITEIDGADYLFQSSSLLKRLEERIARFYQVNATAISTGGSTLCIQAMLGTAFRKGDRILAGRNAHAAFVNACALLDLEPIWVLPKALDHTGISGAITPAQIEEGLAANPDVKGVYLTSPDYLGVLCDIASIAELCHKKDVLLVVDNAHGAALKLSEPDLHPMAQGADLCCDSAHKTLPVLTGGAFLHYSDRFTPQQIKAKMALFGTTSPSYLTMLSIELCMDWMEQHGNPAYRQTALQIEKLKVFAAKNGIPCLTDQETDPFRLSLQVGVFGFDDQAAGHFFRERAIEPEYIGGGYAVFLATPFLQPQDWMRLEDAILSLGKLPHQAISPIPALAPPKVIFTPTRVLFTESHPIPITEALGKVAAQTVITCPPGVPILIPGEEITQEILEMLSKSGYQTVSVLI